ncbi:MAG: hypothetical protein IJ088_01525 [Clostridia bacterium]|nr:hypothetical protein [Clostridia bacterium]
MKPTFRISKLIPWLLLGLALALSLFVYARYGLHTLDADQSSEFVLANHLNQKRALLSTDWFYSTELRTVSPVPIYQLGLALFPSWHAARLFSILIIALGTTAAFLFAARQAGCQEEAIYCAACFILPYSKVHAFLFSWGGFYSMYLILGCLALGLILSIDRTGHSIPKLLLLIFLGIWSGTAGIRMFMIFGVPFLFACLVSRLKAPSLSTLGKTSNSRLLITAGVFLLSMLTGYLINRFILSPRFHYKEYGTLITDTFQFSEFLKHIDELINYFGYKANTVIVSLDGGISFLLILLVFALLSIPFVLLRHRPLPYHQRLLAVFAVSAIFFVWLLDCVAVGYSATPYAVGYFMMGLLFALLSVFLAIRYFCPAILQKCLMVALTLLFFGNTVSFVRRDIPSHDLQQAKAAAWLEENGYTTGYATFWNGNLLTEFSNGKLDVYIYASWQSRKPYEWLQTVQHATQQPDGPVFLYTDTEELALSAPPCLSEDHLVYAEGAVRIYSYDHAEDIYLKQLDQVVDPNSPLLTGIPVPQL